MSIPGVDLGGGGGPKPPTFLKNNFETHDEERLSDCDNCIVC